MKASKEELNWIKGVCMFCLLVACICAYIHSPALFFAGVFWCMRGGLAEWIKEEQGRK